MPTGNAVGLRCIPGGYCPTHPQGKGVYMTPMPTAPWLAALRGRCRALPQVLLLRRQQRRVAHTSWPAPSSSTAAAAAYDGRGGADNDVWATSDGTTWYLIGGQTLDGTVSRYNSAPMTDQGRTADCYDSTGRMYLIAGTAPGDLVTSNVWSSTDAGRNWQFMGEAPFTKREAAACATDSKNQVIVMAGAINDNDIIENYLNDVWTSANYGATWTQADGLPLHVSTARDALLLPASTGWLLC